MISYILLVFMLLSNRMEIAVIGEEPISILEMGIKQLVQVETSQTDSLSYPSLVTVPTNGWDAFLIDSEGIYCVYTGESYVFIKENGESIASDMIFETAYPFYEGLACVSAEGKYGYIDKNGKVVIPFLYDYATPFVEGLAYFVKGEQYGFLDKSGNIVFYLDCDSVSSFQEGLAFYSIDGKYGYIDKTGKTVIAPSYDDVGYFHNGLAEVARNGQRGVIGMDGQEIVPLEYQKVNWNESFLLAEKEDTCICFDRSGRKLLEGANYSIQLNDTYIYFQKDGKYGVLNQEGESLIEPIYDAITLVSEKKLAIVREGKQVGIIDWNGEIKVPFLYEEIVYQEDVDLFAVCLERKWGCLDGRDYSEQIPIRYSRMDSFVEGQAVVCLDGIYQVINQRGEQIVSVSGEGLERIGDCYRVTREEQYGFLNKKGEEIIPAICKKSYKNTYFASEIYQIIQDEERMNRIVRTGASDSSNLLKLVLRNEITPRVKELYRLVQKGGIEERITDETIKRYQLYDIEQTGKPVLYYYALPYVRFLSFPHSYSGFYTEKDGEGKELVLGYECGGSLRGDCVCIWKDKETEELLLGTIGTFGGIGGYILERNIYNYKDGQMELLCSWYLEDIKEKKYFINEEPATEEEYNKLEERYQRVSLIGCE